MKIYIEGSAIFTNNKSGVGQYSKRLTEALLDELKTDDSLHVYGFMPLRKNTRKQMKSIKDPRLKYKIIPMPAIVYNAFLKIFHIHLPVDLLMLKKPDIIIFPNYFVHPTIMKTKKLAVIHDLGFIHYPETISPRNLYYLNKYIPYTIKQSDKIITVSSSSKKQIAKEYNIPANNLEVVYPFNDQKEYYPRAKKEVISVKNKLKIRGKYILFVGTIEPRKNIQGLLGAYHQLDNSIKSKYGLVLAGGKGWLDEDIQKTINANIRSGDNIILTGYVDDDDLPALNSGASLMIYPSLCEGFGMSVLDAMACGVPVITSNNSSLPEVVGDAAILINPKNVNDISKSIKRVLTSADLSQKMREKDLGQAKKFSAKQSAQKLYSILKND